MKNKLIFSLEMMAHSPYESSLKGRVASEILENVSTDQEVKDFFQNLIWHGCVSGMIGSLVYYADTHKFFDEFYEDIEDLRCEYEDEFCSPLKINGDLKNWLAWFGFEEMARKIYDEIIQVEPVSQ